VNSKVKPTGSEENLRVEERGSERRCEVNGDGEASEGVGVDAQQPLVLRPGRRQTVLLILVCSVFVALGIWLALRGERIAYYAAAFFGVCLLVAVIHSLPGAAYLRLEPNGFTFCNLFRKQSVPWTDVARFSVTFLGAQSTVGWNYRPGHGPSSRASAVAKAICRCEGALPDTYGMNPYALAELMNELLEEYGTPNPEAHAAQSGERTPDAGRDY
jgi:hypothetical protein